MLLCVCVCVAVCVLCVCVLCVCMPVCLIVYRYACPYVRMCVCTSICLSLCPFFIRERERCRRRCGEKRFRICVFSSALLHHLICFSCMFFDARSFSRSRRTVNLGDKHYVQLLSTTHIDLAESYPSVNSVHLLQSERLSIS